MYAGWLIHQIVAEASPAAGVAPGLGAIGVPSPAACACLWLFNPVAAAVSTRGNAEPLIMCTVLGMLRAAQRGSWGWAGLLLGLAAHLKIFPALYAVPMLLAAGPELLRTGAGWRGWLRRLASPGRLRLVGCAAAGFALPTAGAYWLYGDEYVQEAWVHHLARRDHRHNFSPHFYLLYLARGRAAAGLLCFVPQLALVVHVAVTQHRSLAFCCFLQTLLFVALNKVCTSQYFVWWLALLAPAMPHLAALRRTTAVRLAVQWAAAQGLWLLAAYRLEFHGDPAAFTALFIAGLLLLGASTHAAVVLSRANRCSTKAE